MAQSRWVDYYAVLELYDPINQTGNGPHASIEEIKEAWKLQNWAWHPSRFRSGSDEYFKAERRTQVINEAYDVLKDAAKKTAYDAEWLQRNPWFRQEQSSTNSAPPEIAVRWDPPDVQSSLFFKIPRGEKRRARLFVEPRVGRGFTVEILEPESGWLRVLDPPDRRGIPPFIAVVEVDTTQLHAEQIYSDDLLFVVEEG